MKNIYRYLEEEALESLVYPMKESQYENHYLIFVFPLPSNFAQIIHYISDFV
jgi:hypothetical protein